MGGRKERVERSNERFIEQTRMELVVSTDCPTSLLTNLTLMHALAENILQAVMYCKRSN